MGMIWNSPDTASMVHMLNREFGKGIIRKWRKNRDLFGTTSAKKLLHEIADMNDIYPDSGPDGDAGVKWIAWLKYLNTQKAGTAGEDLRAAIYAGLKPGAFDEIVFVLVPLKDNAQVGVSATSITAGTTTALVITIQTPTWNAVYQFAKTAPGRTALKKLKMKLK